MKNIIHNYKINNNTGDFNKHYEKHIIRGSRLQVFDRITFAVHKTEISPNFLVGKFYGNANVSAELGKCWKEYVTIITQQLAVVGSDSLTIYQPAS